MAALTRLSDDEEIARQLYRMGFRSLDEVIEANAGELASVQGISEEEVYAVKERAASAMEELRQEMLEAMAQRTEAPSERERLLLVRGVNSRIADQLEHAGYGSVELVDREDDTDRLSIKSGLGTNRTQTLKETVRLFLQDEWPAIEARLSESVARAQAEARAAEEAVAAEAETPVATEPSAEAEPAPAPLDLEGSPPADATESSPAPEPETRQE